MDRGGRRRRTFEGGGRSRAIARRAADMGRVSSLGPGGTLGGGSGRDFGNESRHTVCRAQQSAADAAGGACTIGSAIGAAAHRECAVMTACPTKDELERLLGESLSDPEFARILAHVEDCAACQESLQTLAASAPG